MASSDLAGIERLAIHAQVMAVPWLLAGCALEHRHPDHLDH